MDTCRLLEAAARNSSVVAYHGWCRSNKDKEERERERHQAQRTSPQSVVGSGRILYKSGVYACVCERERERESVCGKQVDWKQPMKLS